MTLRWSTWSAQTLAAMSCAAPGLVRVLAIADGPGNAPLLVCTGWRMNRTIMLIDPAGEIQPLDMSEPRDTSVDDLMVASTGSGRIVAWRERSGIQVRDLDRPDARLRIGRTRRPRLRLWSVGDIDGRAVVVASERARWSRKAKTSLWDAGTGQVIGELPVSPGEKDIIRAIAITSSAAGEPLLIIGERDGRILVWDLPDVRLRHVFQDAAAHHGTAASNDIPMIGGGPAGGLGDPGDLTVVASVRKDRLSCWRLETGELLHSTEIRSKDRPRFGLRDSRELAIGQVGDRAVIAWLSWNGPVAFEADSGARVPLLSHDRGAFTTAALRATPSGIVHAIAPEWQIIRCHLLQEAPDDAGETGVEDVAVGTWDGRMAVLSRDIDQQLRVRDLRTGELLERRDWMFGRRLGVVAGRIVSYYYGDRPVDLLTGEETASPLQVSRDGPWLGSPDVNGTWWGSPDGEDQVAVGVLSRNSGGSDSYTRVWIAVWDGTTGQLRSLREINTESTHVALAVGTVGGEPALVSAGDGHDLTIESLAADPVSRRSELSRPRWQARRSAGWASKAVVMLSDGYLAYSQDDGIVRVLRCVRSGSEARLEDSAEIDVGAQVTALAYAGDGQLVIGCGAGVQLAEIAGLAR